jgi:hypothetical protein
LRVAFDKVLVDPDFIADAEKSRLEINGPLSGVNVEKLINELHMTPTQLVQNAISILGGAK